MTAPDPRLEFARACRAAARAVALYPAAHPAIGVALGRLAAVTERTTANAPVTITIASDALLFDGEQPDRGDPALAELAALLHGQAIGRLIVRPGTTGGVWRQFLALLSEPPEKLRADGGIGRAWLTAGAPSLEITEIDYAEVLRERAGGAAADWRAIVARALEAGTPLEGGMAEELLRTMPVEEVLTLVEGGGPGEPPGSAGPVALLQQAPDAAIAHFITRAAMSGGAASARLARALGALVPDADRRRRVLRQVRDDVAAAGEEQPEAEILRSEVASLIESYSDNQFVGHDYERELSGAQRQAEQIEEITDDPPEQVGEWLQTVTASSVRALDHQLLLDLLAVEDEGERWKALVAPVLARLDDLLLIGDFAAARQFVSALAAEAGPAAHPARQPAAAAALDALVSGSLVQQMAAHLQTIDDDGFAAAKAICTDLGEAVTPALADVLARETRDRAQQRLTELLLGFGASGRQAVERLRASTNPTVRRTAAALLRAFGGTESLTDLAALVQDREPAVQREAIRAILAIGSQSAYDVLAEAIGSATPHSRDLMVRAIASLKAEDPAPLLCHLVRAVSHRGSLADVHARAMELLGSLGDPAAVPVLVTVLERREWWAPRRTALLRTAAAGALGRIGGPEAERALRDAAERGSRGLRAAARAALEARGDQRP